MQGPSAEASTTVSQPVFVACAFPELATAAEAVRTLIAAGVPAGDIGLGARAPSADAARDLAHELGVRADVDPEDPLAQAPELASDARSRWSIDRGGVLGGAIGAVVGLALGFVPRFAGVPVEPQYRPLADALLFFVVGAIAGAGLGGALAPQRSSHAAFRIVDEIEHSGVALVATVAPSLAAHVVAALIEAGGLHVMRVPQE